MKLKDRVKVKKCKAHLGQLGTVIDLGAIKGVITIRLDTSSYCVDYEKNFIKI